MSQNNWPRLQSYQQNRSATQDLKIVIQYRANGFVFGYQGKKDIDFCHWHLDDVKILQTVRHNKKLRIGAIKQNKFNITLRNIEATEALESRLSEIKKIGVPNYFGEQRFGRYEDNVAMARDMFNGKKVKDRKKRSLYLSAARSFVFNQIVSYRIREKKAQTMMQGDVILLSGSRSHFVAEFVDQELEQRLADNDIQLSAPLVGDGELASKFAAREFEQHRLIEYSDLIDGLKKAGLKQQRRAIILKPENMNWSLAGNLLQLSFELPSGSFATSVLREVLNYQDMS